MEKNSLFLIANLGSEVSRIFSAKKKGNSDLFESAMNRAKKIIYELKSLPDVKNNAEIDMLADVIYDIKKIPRKYDIPSEQLQSYFIPFSTRFMNSLALDK